MSRVILIVMDSLGIGALPDAVEFGDAGADTFGHIYDAYPTMISRIIWESRISVKGMPPAL